jgi:phosphatidylglycerol:prolipoprotein diacylglycerol transferase
VHPILIELGRFKIYSYGFMLALSFFVGVVIAGRRAEGKGISKEIVQDLSIILIILAVVGSRTLYIVTHRDNYRSIIDIIALWQGGATYYGGILLAIAGAVVYLRKKKIPFFRMADICSPSIALGIFFTRIGCFMSGCCFGRPTECPLGITFPADSPAGQIFPGGAVHPTQLYSSLYGIAIFVLLVLMERRRSYDGFVFSLFCIFYGAARFLVDFFRYYDSSAMLTQSMTVNQGISIAVAVLGAIMLAILSRRR